MPATRLSVCQSAGLRAKSELRRHTGAADDEGAAIWAARLTYLGEISPLLTATAHTEFSSKETVVVVGSLVARGSQER